MQTSPELAKDAKLLLQEMERSDWTNILSTCKVTVSWIFLRSCPHDECNIVQIAATLYEQAAAQAKLPPYQKRKGAGSTRRHLAGYMLSKSLRGQRARAFCRPRGQKSCPQLRFSKIYQWDSTKTFELADVHLQEVSSTAGMPSFYRGPQNKPNWFQNSCLLC